MTGRFDQLLRKSAPREFADLHGLQHREAFCLMWYGCEACRHRERTWNSRDGVTPFCTLCPSCGKPSLRHIDWGLDEYAPDHKPTIGQRIWVSMTKERACAIADRRIRSAIATGHLTSAQGAECYEGLVNSIYQGGMSPALDVFGYSEAADRERAGSVDARVVEDAERYRWLRDVVLEFNQTKGAVIVAEFIAPIAYGPDIDAAIDAARSKP